MARMKLVEHEEATGRTKESLDKMKAKVGQIRNVVKLMANSHVGVEAYMALNQVLGSGSLDSATRERLALATGEQTGCEYCVSAHTLIGKHAGLSADEMLENRKGGSTDPRMAAIVRFGREVVETNGHVPDSTLGELRKHDVSDGEIVEILVTVVLNLFTNYLNHVANPEVDFPKVPLLEKS